MAAAVPTRSSSFFEWLAGRTASEATLSEYLASSGEWWNSEFKAASEDVDYSLRKAVCALANTRGGEVFVGVRDDRTISGTTRTGQQLGQVLKQSAAPPGEWYVVDLTRAVFRIVPVPVGVASPRRFVYVLEIVRVGLPVLVFETRQKLEIMRRQGMNRGEEYRETDDVLRSAREDIPRSAESFKRYLEDHGIAAD